MNKEKKFFAGMAAAALVLGASLFFTGCGGGGDGEPVYLRTGTVSGTMSAAALEELVAEAAQEGAVRIRNVTVTGGGSVNLGTATVRIAGTLDLGAAVLAAAEATMSFAGAEIAGTGVIISNDGRFGDYLAAGNSINVYGPTAEAGVDTALESGVVATKNYTQPAAFSANNNLYVYGKLTVGDSTASGTPTGDGKIIAVGTVEVTATNALALVDPAKVDYTGAAITVGAGVAAPVEITFADTTMGKAQFNLAQGKILKVLGATTVGTTAAPVSVSGKGTLVLAAAVSAANITGSGNIEFTDAAEGATDFTASASSVTGATVTFTNGLSTVEASPLTLGGNIVLPAEQAISFDNAAGTLTLKKGATIRKAADGAPILTAATQTVLTPAQNATLTAATDEVQTLTVGGAALTLTSGTLAVGGNGTLALDAAETGLFTVATAGRLTVAGALVIGTGGTLTAAGNGTVTAGNIALGAGTWKALAAATTVEPGVVTIGSGTSPSFGADDGDSNTVLTGTDAATNTFTASGGTVTLAQSSAKLTITGSAAGATAGIKVKAGLDITTATVDISSADTSIIVLVDNDQTGIKLADTNSVILLDAAKAVVKTSELITDLAVGQTVTVMAATAGKSALVGSFVGGDTAETNTLKESNSGVSIMKGLAVASE